jgi:hypothetical protein
MGQDYPSGLALPKYNEGPRRDRDLTLQEQELFRRMLCFIHMNVGRKQTHIFDLQAKLTMPRAWT